MAGLSAKQQRFVEEYLVDLNATQAAIRAGYSVKNAKQIGHQSLHRPEVAAAILRRREKVSKKLDVTVERVLLELARIGFSDVRNAIAKNGALLPIDEMPEDMSRVIAAIETEELFDGSGENRVRVGQTRKVKLWDKGQALVQLGKHLGMFTEKIEMKIEDLSAEQRAERVKELIAKAKARKAGK